MGQSGEEELTNEEQLLREAFPEVFKVIQGLKEEVEKLNHEVAGLHYKVSILISKSAGTSQPVASPTYSWDIGKPKPWVK